MFVLHQKINFGCVALSNVLFYCFTAMCKVWGNDSSQCRRVLINIKMNNITVYIFPGMLKFFNKIRSKRIAVVLKNSTRSALKSGQSNCSMFNESSKSNRKKNVGDTSQKLAFLHWIFFLLFFTVWRCFFYGTKFPIFCRLFSPCRFFLEISKFPKSPKNLAKL